MYHIRTVWKGIELASYDSHIVLLRRGGWDMHRDRIALLIALLVVGLCVGPVAAAAVDLYTNRAAWESAVSTVRMMEDFEAETPGTYMTPYSTSAGISVERFGISMDLIVRDNGAVNDSREFLIKDYGGGSFFSFPSSRRQLGFGFDWVTGAEAWTLKYLGQEYSLAANSSGFFGLADPDAQTMSFELTSPTLTQDGLAMDDLTFSPRLLVFTDHASWESALGLTPFIEGFELELPGSYQTPYTTGGNCSLGSSGSPIDFDIINGGLIDGSVELHLSDPGTQLTLGFPGTEGQRGFGFDWETPFESWSLVVLDEYLSLRGMSGGFVGVVDQTGQIHSFEVSVLGIVQGGLHLDNIAFASGTVPVRAVTWGQLKSRYR